MSHDDVLGLLFWVLLTYPIWSPRCRRIRRNERRAQAAQAAEPAAWTVPTGPKWEQDVPYPECFTDEGDDLDDC